MWWERRGCCPFPVFCLDKVRIVTIDCNALGNWVDWINFFDFLNISESAMKKRWLRLLSLGLLLGTLWFGTVACSPQPPSQFEQAQQESTQRGAQAVTKESNKGGEFNAFFPTAEGEYERIFTQEKQGFAQIKLKQNGEEMAVMAISDLTNNPSAADKFQASTAEIAGFPSVSQGKNGTVLLVGDRYQVKVMSRSPEFTAVDREAWLQKFDLSGLAALSQNS